MQRACVIGSGPNGLAAAIVLAQAGLRVEVYEAEAEPGGAARTLPLTLPGFLHDFGSAVHPLAAGSPFFTSLPLDDYGLEWVHGDAPLAHPLDDGTAVTWSATLAAMSARSAAMVRPWRRSRARRAHWQQFAGDPLAPPAHIPHHPLRMARFGLSALQPARIAGPRVIFPARAPALYLRGLAGALVPQPRSPLSAGIGLMFGATLHAVGWPSSARRRARHLPRARGLS